MRFTFFQINNEWNTRISAATLSCRLTTVAKLTGFDHQARGNINSFLTAFKFTLFILHGHILSLQNIEESQLGSRLKNRSDDQWTLAPTLDNALRDAVFSLFKNEVSFI